MVVGLAVKQETMSAEEQIDQEQQEDSSSAEEDRKDHVIFINCISFTPKQIPESKENTPNDMDIITC